MTKANILIIDDEVDLCQSLLELLEEEEYQVFIAHSGKEGLIKVKENYRKAGLKISPKGQRKFARFSPFGYKDDRDRWDRNFKENNRH